MYEFGSLCLRKRNTKVLAQDEEVKLLLKELYSSLDQNISIPKDLLYNTSIEQKKYLFSGMIDHFGLIYKHSNTWDISILKYPVVRQQINILASMLGFICKFRYTKNASKRLYISGNFFDLPLKKKSCTDIRKQRNSFGFTIDKSDDRSCLNIKLETKINKETIMIYSTNCFSITTNLN